MIDQSTVSISTRSNPATYAGVMDDIRTAFANRQQGQPLAV